MESKPDYSEAIVKLQALTKELHEAMNDGDKIGANLILDDLDEQVAILFGCLDTM